MISVCIATYNGEKFILQQISSIISQIGPEDEIIVSDDMSADSTVDIIKNIGDSRIRIIKGPARKSPIWNFENAIKHARGEYIFMADQDDVWLPGKVEVMMKHLKTSDCVVSDARLTDEHLNVIADSYYKLRGTRRSPLFNTLIKNGYLGCCMAFTRRVAEAALPFPADIPMHDMWIGNVAAYKFGVKFINDKLVMYRSHGDNFSYTTSGKSGNSLPRMLIIRWHLIKCLATKFISA